MSGWFLTAASRADTTAVCDGGAALGASILTASEAGVKGRMRNVEGSSSKSRDTVLLRPSSSTL